MQRAGARFEEMARTWEPASPAAAPEPSLVVRMYLWLHSEGARREGASRRLRELVAAWRALLEESSPGWYEDLFSGRDFCGACGESYLGENLSLCTDCGALFGPCHRASGGTAPNGNYQCGACGTGEIVG